MDWAVYIQFLLYVLVPIINFFYWMHVAKSANSASSCQNDKIKNDIYRTLLEEEEEVNLRIHHASKYSECHHDSSNIKDTANTVLELVVSKDLSAYRSRNLVKLRNAAPYTMLLNPYGGDSTHSLDWKKNFKSEGNRKSYATSPHDSDIFTFASGVTDLNLSSGIPCTTIVNPVVANKPGVCLAVVFASSQQAPSKNMTRISTSQSLYPLPSQSSSVSYPLLRFNSKSKDRVVLEGDKYLPDGFITSVGTEEGRHKLAENANRLFKNLEIMESTLASVLKSRGFAPGSSLVVMVVNEGEVDMLLNFACSCRAYNISTANFLVFLGSQGAVGAVDSMGMMGWYHDAFQTVSKEASFHYLDSIFTDMMWYKAFSVWMVLKAGYHVLFQDVDLVWFSDPFPYLNGILDKALKDTDRQIYDGLFSDDGQRGLRYAPFYANSGFYYLLASPRTEYFAWSVITAFDSLQVSGSHQNVFSTRMLESMDLAHLSPKLLKLNTFPSGIKFHHDKPFMRAIADKHEQPLTFHMCWTSNKDDKIRYFKQVSMWYTRNELSQCKMSAIATRSARIGTSSKMHDEKWRTLSQECCMTMHGAVNINT